MADRAEKEIRKSHFGKRSKAAETVKGVPANNGTGSVPRSFCMGKTPPDARKGTASGGVLSAVRFQLFVNGWRLISNTL